MNGKRIICLFLFHTWVRRPTPGDPSGYRHECVRCGKLNEGVSVDSRFQGM